MPAKRSTLRSRSGTKLYAKRSDSGQFTDVQSYKHAHGSDIKRRAKAEAGPGKAKPRPATPATPAEE
jgi:hypothetical protein